MTRNTSQTALTDHNNTALTWSAAVTQLRSEYGDTYGDRVEAAAAIKRAASNAPQELGGEAVLQPLLRYQDCDPDDARHLIEQKHGDEIAARVQDAVIEYVATLE